MYRTNAYDTIELGKIKTLGKNSQHTLGMVTRLRSMKKCREERNKIIECKIMPLSPSFGSRHVPEKPISQEALAVLSLAKYFREERIQP